MSHDETTKASLKDVYEGLRRREDAPAPDPVTQGIQKGLPGFEDAPAAPAPPRPTQLPTDPSGRHCARCTEAVGFTSPLSDARLGPYFLHLVCCTLADLESPVFVLMQGPHGLQSHETARLLHQQLEERSKVRRLYWGRSVVRPNTLAVIERLSQGLPPERRIQTPFTKLVMGIDWGYDDVAMVSAMRIQRQMNKTEAAVRETLTKFLGEKVSPELQNDMANTLNRLFLKELEKTGPAPAETPYAKAGDDFILQRMSEPPLFHGLMVGINDIVAGDVMDQYVVGPVTYVGKLPLRTDMPVEGRHFTIVAQGPPVITIEAPTDPVQAAEWRAKIKAEIEKWRQDPCTILVREELEDRKVIGEAAQRSSFFDRLEDAVPWLKGESSEAYCKRINAKTALAELRKAVHDSKPGDQVEFPSELAAQIGWPTVADMDCERVERDKEAAKEFRNEVLCKPLPPLLEGETEKQWRARMKEEAPSSKEFLPLVDYKPAARLEHTLKDLLYLQELEKAQAKLAEDYMMPSHEDQEQLAIDAMVQSITEHEDKRFVDAIDQALAQAPPKDLATTIGHIERQELQPAKAIMTQEQYEDMIRTVARDVGIPPEYLHGGPFPGPRGLDPNDKRKVTVDEDGTVFIPCGRALPKSTSISMGCRAPNPMCVICGKTECLHKSAVHPASTARDLGSTKETLVVASVEVTGGWTMPEIAEKKLEDGMWGRWREIEDKARAQWKRYYDLSGAPEERRILNGVHLQGNRAPEDVVGPPCITIPMGFIHSHHEDAIGRIVLRVGAPEWPACADRFLLCRPQDSDGEMGFLYNEGGQTLVDHVHRSGMDEEFVYYQGRWKPEMGKDAAGNPKVASYTLPRVLDYPRYVGDMRRALCGRYDSRVSVERCRLDPGHGGDHKSPVASWPQTLKNTAATFRIETKDGKPEDVGFFGAQPKPSPYQPDGHMESLCSGCSLGQLYEDELHMHVSLNPAEGHEPCLEHYTRAQRWGANRRAEALGKKLGVQMAEAFVGELEKFGPLKSAQHGELKVPFYKVDMSVPPGPEIQAQHRKHLATVAHLRCRSFGEAMRVVGLAAAYEKQALAYSGLTVREFREAQAFTAVSQLEEYLAAQVR